LRNSQEKSKNIRVRLENNMTTKETQEEIIKELKKINDWEDKYAYLVGLGKNLPPMDPKNKVEDNLIKGCDVSTWLSSAFKDGKIFYEVDSNSLIVKGLGALLLRVLSGQNPEDIKNIDLNFIDEIGLGKDFLASRADNFWKVVEQMKLNAAFYATMSAGSR
jgi:cysteine desulfuration protein SufE